MKGKKIGVQATNEAVWNAFLKANAIDPSSITKVPVQFDPSPLVAGTVDGWFSFVTNEPNLLKTQGVETKTFLLADYKYPLVSETYVVKKDSLTSKRDEIKAMLVADIKGWQQNLKDPTIGAKLAANVYGKDQKLTVEEQTLESTSENAAHRDRRHQGERALHDHRPVDRREHQHARPGEHHHHQGQAVRHVGPRRRCTPSTPS